MSNKPDTSFLEIYRRALLPLMGIMEVIGTKGRSPGTVAQASMRQFDEADHRKQENAEWAHQAAMREALYGDRKQRDMQLSELRQLRLEKMRGARKMPIKPPLENEKDIERREAMRRYLMRV